jgi:hypothetical protein
MVTSRSVLLTTRNISEKILEKIKTNIECSIRFFFENNAVYERSGKIL